MVGEGTQSKAGRGAAPARHGGRRPGRLHRRRCTGSRRAWTTATSWWRARSPRPRSARAPRAPSSGSTRSGATAASGRWRKPRSGRADGIDVVAIVTPNHIHCAGRQGVPRARHPRHLRQAADHDAGGRAGAGGAGRKPGARVRADAQLHRLPDDPAGAPDGRRRAARPLRVVQAEYAQDWLTTRLEETGHKQAAWRVDPKRSGPGRLHGRHRHPRHEPRQLRQRPPARAARGRPDHLRPGPARSTTTATSSCASRAGPRACCGRARWRPATRTRCGSASTARRAASPGRRRTRTTSTTRPSASRRG